MIDETLARYEAALRQIGTPAHVPKGFDPLDWWHHRASHQGQLAREALGVTAEDLIRATWEETTNSFEPAPPNPKNRTNAGQTVSDTSSRA